jgi:hypothetical protein
MEEARKVIERLERIDELRRAEAPAPTLLAEVRALLSEGEAWLAVERAGELAGAAAALRSCRERLAPPQEVVPEAAL